MQKFKSNFLNELEWRGLLNQCSNLEKLDNVLATGEKNNKPVVAYLGVDPTADSIHVGHLTAVTMMQLFQKCGHKPIMLVGGATGYIGDPKENEERPLLTPEKIAENVEGLKKSYKKFINFGDGPTDSIIVDNYDWFKGVGYIDFLRDIGKHVPVSKLLGLDRIKSRVHSDVGLTFLEFNYPLLQGYDFLHLNEKYNCELQLCGADQWGNSIMGLDIIRRKKAKEVFVLTTPLLTDSNGKKMGKSEGNAIWVNDEKLSAYDYYQYFRNVDDKDVIQLLKIFTDLSQEEIEKMAKWEGAELNEAKKVLAFEATKMCRGEYQAKIAEETAIKTFEQGGVGEDLPTFTVDLSKNPAVIDVLTEITNTLSSKKEVRRMIEQGGIKINDDKVDDANQTLSEDKLIDEKIVISIGKKKKIVIENS